MQRQVVGPLEISPSPTVSPSNAFERHGSDPPSARIPETKGGLDGQATPTSRVQPASCGCPGRPRERMSETCGCEKPRPEVAPARLRRDGRSVMGTRMLSSTIGGLEFADTFDTRGRQGSLRRSAPLNPGRFDCLCGTCRVGSVGCFLRPNERVPPHFGADTPTSYTECFYMNTATRRREVIVVVGSDCPEREGLVPAFAIEHQARSYEDACALAALRIALEGDCCNKSSFSIARCESSGPIFVEDRPALGGRCCILYLTFCCVPSTDAPGPDTPR